MTITVGDARSLAPGPVRSRPWQVALTKWHHHRIAFCHPRPGEKAADVKVMVLNEDRFVHLEGIVVREPRPGWVTLEVPPLEVWEKPLRWLSREQRERVESPEFFKLLEEQIARRYLALVNRSG